MISYELHWKKTNKERVATGLTYEIAKEHYDKAVAVGFSARLTKVEKIETVLEESGWES